MFFVYVLRSVKDRKCYQEREKFFKTGWGRQYLQKVLKYYFRKAS